MGHLCVFVCVGVGGWGLDESKVCVCACVCSMVTKGGLCTNGITTCTILGVSVCVCVRQGYATLN